MALGNPGSRGVISETTSDNQLTGVTSQQIDAGHYVVAIAMSNGAGTTDGETNYHTALSVGALSLTKVKEWTEGGASAAASVTVSQWMGVATAQINNGSTITFDLDAARADKMVRVLSGTRDTSKSFEVADGTYFKTDNYISSGGNDMRSNAIAGLTNEEHLCLASWACDATATTFTASTNFTRVATTATVIGTNGMRLEWRVNTSTGNTTDPSSNCGNSTEWSLVFVAYREVVTATTHDGDLTTVFSMSQTSAGTIEKVGVAGTTSFAMSVASEGERTATGVSSTAFAMSVSSAANIDAHGAASVSFTMAVASAGTRERLGESSSTFSMAVASAGDREATATVGTVSFSMAVASTGEREASGASTTTFSFALTSAGERTATGVSSVTFATAVSTAGTRERLGESTTTSTFVVSSAGTREALGVVSLPFNISVVVAGAAEKFGVVSLPFSFTVNTEGGIDGQDVEGVVSLSTTFAITTAGQLDSFGSASSTFSFAIATTATRERTGASTTATAFSISTAGERTATGAASVHTIFGISTAGSREQFGEASLTVAFSISTEGIQQVSAIEGDVELTFGFVVSTDGQRGRVSDALRAFRMVHSAYLPIRSAPRGAAGRTFPKWAQGAKTDPTKRPPTDAE